MKIHLASATTSRVPERATVLVPIGSTAPHGPHLPLDTDTEIAIAVAEAAAKLLSRRRVRVVVAPAIAYGSGGEHELSAGTVSIGPDALRLLLVEVARSIRAWAERVVFVDAHGGSAVAFRQAVSQLADEGHDVDWVPCAGETGPHAGQAEMSLMLHLKPWDVRIRRAAPGAKVSRDALVTVGAGGGAASPDRALNELLVASAEEGMDVLDSLAWRVVRRVLGRPVD